MFVLSLYMDHFLSFMQESFYKQQRRKNCKNPIDKHEVFYYMGIS
jgi:hypothetical protein